MINLKTFANNKPLTAFLQFVVVIVALGFFSFLIWEPMTEGVNANATLLQIYFQDSFLAFMYMASIPFFIIMYKSFKLLGFINQNKIFSNQSIAALKIIKYCALILIGFLLIAESYFFIFVRGKDDIAGGVAMCIGFIFISSVVATTATLLEHLLQKAVDIKSENDLTI